LVIPGFSYAERKLTGQSDKEIRALKAQLRASKTDLDAKDGECVDLQEEMATLKEKSKERERELKMKLKEAAAASEQVVALQVRPFVLGWDDELTEAGGGGHS
jgi:chromosome segregation ATPase